LKDLSVISRRPVEDSALAQLRNLSRLAALTRATNPLDLSGLHRLAKIEIDDRDGLAGLGHRTLLNASIFGNQRHLADFAGAVALENVKMEGGPQEGVALRAELPNLRRLMVSDGGVQSFDGLVAPKLEWLQVGDDRKPVYGVFDLAPLASCRELQRVTLVTVGEVRNLAVLADSAQVEVRLGPKVNVDEAELRRLPAKWRAENLDILDR
jgi:hypothetical protein